jgi:two-component system nitrogen regulation sensor histidine kinase GlnL
LYQQLIDNQTTAIVLLNEQLQVVYINNAAETLLATSAARTKNQPAKELFLNFDADLIELKNTLINRQSYTKREAHLLIFNSGEITVDYTVTPFAEKSKRYLMLEIFPLDRWLKITREENLQWQHETSQTLIRGFAHEIKNPLGGIRGAAQLLARELPEASLQEYTDVIIEEADRLRNLIDEMLGPYRPITLTPMNIHFVLERITNLIESECAGQIEVIRDYDPSIPELPGNQERLIQAFLNIARNAVQSLLSRSDNQPRTISVVSRTIRQITLSNVRHKIVCRVDIIDNGPGIAEDIQDALFYPMVSGRAQGTGLGLTIAQHIINQHHGLIEFESQPGRTCFTVFLPLDIEAHTSADSTTKTGATP